jgi:hypothetical protein
MIAALFTWLAIQAAASDCAAGTGGEETRRTAGCLGTDDRTACGVALEKTAVS